MDHFWKGSAVPARRLSIGADELQAIVVFIMARLRGCPQIFSHLKIIEEFTTEAVCLSNRGYYLTMVQTSLEHILQVREELIAEKVLKEDSRNQSIRNIETIIQN